MTPRDSALTYAEPRPDEPRPERASPPTRRARIGVRELLTRYRPRLVAMTAVGAVLRFAFLGHQPLWRDEAFTALAVHRSVGAMLHVVAHDSAPPLSYLTQHLLVSLWGGAGGLRALSALAGTAAIPLGAALGRRVGGDRLGLWCAATFAFFPSLVLVSRDARMYATATTLVLASTLALWRLVERPTGSRTIVYGALVAAALATNYFALFATVGQLIAALIILRPSRQAMVRGVLAAAAAGATLVPWLVYARAQFTHGSGPFWVGGVGVSTIGGVVGQFFSGPSIDPGVPGLVALEAVQGVVIVIGLAAAAVVLVRWRTLDRRARVGGRFLAVGSLGGMALLVAVSVWHPLVEARYASVMWGPLVVLVALGYAQTPWRRVAPAALAVTGAASVVLSLALTGPDTPALVRDVTRHLGRHDLIATAPAAYLLVLQYGNPTTRGQTRAVSTDVPWYWGTAVFPPGAVLRGYPTGGVRGAAAIDDIDVPGQTRALTPPSSYRAIGPRRCYRTICLTRYRPAPSDPSTQARPTAASSNR